MKLFTLNLSPPRQHTPSVFLSSARTISDLFHSYHLTWGIDYIPWPIIQWISDVLFILIDHLNDSKNMEAFLVLMVTARALARRQALGRNILDVVVKRIEERGMEGMLPSDVRAWVTEWRLGNKEVKGNA